MTARRQGARAAPAIATMARPASARPDSLSEAEKLIYPAWLDQGGASGGPSYLGHIVVLLLVALPLILVVLAALVFFVGS
jgi:hypothetical protein